MRQDIRPLQIALLNLMPNKVRTETQFARLIGATPLQIELTLIRMSEHTPKNTSAEHMEAFYRPFPELAGEKFDGLIVTGAPIELLPFEEVTYWDELCQVFDWSQTNVHSTFAVCWGAQAMLHHFHGVREARAGEKGVRLLPAQEPRAGLALSARLLGRVHHPGQPLDRDPRGRAAAGPRPDRADERRRDGPVPDRGPGPPGALHVQPHRVRHDLAEGGVRPRRRQGRADRGAGQLLSRRRSVAARPRTAGAATPTCCWATGSTRSTRRRPSR